MHRHQRRHVQWVYSLLAARNFVQRKTFRFKFFGGGCEQVTMEWSMLDLYIGKTV